MNKKELIKTIIEKNNGIAKTADFCAVGLSNFDVANLCKTGFLKRIRHGYYQLAEELFISEEQTLASLVPGSVLCVESALYYYGYNDFTPRKWSIAVPRTYSRTKLKNSTLFTKVYYIQTNMFELGRTEEEFNGAKLLIYDRERTICDCFKYRTKLDSEIFNKALNYYVADKNKNLGRLAQYAKQMHLFEKVLNVIGVLVNE